MPTNDEKREGIMIELNKRAISEGSTERYFSMLMPAMVSLYHDAQGDAVKMMGLAQALLRHSMAVFYGSCTTPADLQVRTAEDAAKMAGAVWDEACRNAEQLSIQLDERGIEVPKDMRDRIAAMPSDPSKRPDLEPIDSSAGIQGRPRSVADLLSRFSQPEPEPEPKTETTSVEGKSTVPTTKVKSPEFITWSGGSTMQELHKVGNGKGN